MSGYFDYRDAEHAARVHDQLLEAEARSLVPPDRYRDPEEINPTEQDIEDMEDELYAAIVDHLRHVLQREPDSDEVARFERKVRKALAKRWLEKEK